jgi:hypothetical protein
VTVTDDEGGFDVRELPAGQFSIRVTKDAFVTSSFSLYAQASLGSDLKAGQQLDRGDLSLPRGGVIAGRAIDEHGDALAGQRVEAWRVEYTEPGTRRLVREQSVSADDRGDFRLYGLRPGKYYVSATFAEWQMSVARPGATATQFVNSGGRLTTTFYPGNTQLSDALPVAVTAGEDTAGLVIRALSVPLARVSGRVIDSRGAPARDINVILTSARSDTPSLSNTSVLEVNPQGQFQFVNVPPGDYRVDVQATARLATVGTTGSLPPAGEYEFASQPLTVNGDVRELLVQTSRGLEVSGRIVVDRAPAPPTLLKNLGFGAGMSTTMNAAGGPVQPDGSFVIRGVVGNRLIRVGGLPAGVVLNAIIARGQDVTDAGLETVQDNVPGVEIQLTTKPTNVVGDVTDINGAATRDYAVVIFADDSRTWTHRRTRFVVSARPAADGRFTVRGLPAGRYLAVALAQLVDGQWADPENLERLRTLAVPFALADGEARSLKLLLGPAKMAAGSVRPKSTW